MTSGHADSEDRRQHPRIKKNYIIRFYEKNNPSVKYDVSQIENISQGGMCFSSTMHLNEGSLVAVELRTPFLSDTVYLEGTILQSRDKVPGLIYENRIRFQEVSPTAIDVLTKIEQYNSNKKV